LHIRFIRLGVIAFFVVYALASTWPGALLVADGGPLVLGLPRSLVWAILWILLGLAALVLLDHFEGRARTREREREQER
jgi:hypothetical protein